MDKWKAVRVFVDNAPDQWHVSTGKWGEQSIAVAKDEATAYRLSTLPELVEAGRQMLKELNERGITCSKWNSIIAKAEGGNR